MNENAANLFLQCFELQGASIGFCFSDIQINFIFKNIGNIYFILPV